MLVARVTHRYRLEQRLVEVLPVRQLGLVQVLVDTGLDLLGQEVVGRHYHVVTGLAGEQLGFQGFIAVENVIDNLDTRLGFKLLDGVWSNVVGPVVYVQHFIVRLCCRRHHAHQGHGEEGLAS